jgi:fido (protein-threonine AMPylation protein)
MSDKFGDERDPYLYPALNVLRNRLGIRQAKNLQQAAFEMTALRAAPCRWAAGARLTLSVRYSSSAVSGSV